METVAWPPTTGAVRVGPPPMSNVTVPVGVPTPSGTTVALKATAWPKTEKPGKDVIRVMVAAMARPSESVVAA